MTRLLVDENFPHSVSLGLVAAGHDVQTISELAPGINDETVLAMACAQQRCLVTFDSDFGELVFQQGQTPPDAIFYLRVHPIVSAEVLALTLRAIEESPAGGFVVVTKNSRRCRPFPDTPGP